MLTALKRKAEEEPIRELISPPPLLFVQSWAFVGRKIKRKTKWRFGTPKLQRSCSFNKIEKKNEFQQILDKISAIDNSVSDNHVKYQVQIHCILSYIKMTNVWI